MSSQQSCRHGENAPADFAPDFSKGLVPAIAQDQATGEVLMLAYMNEEAWRKTLETGEAHYWSRSRRRCAHCVWTATATPCCCSSSRWAARPATAGGAPAFTGNGRTEP